MQWGLMLGAEFAKFNRIETTEQDEMLEPIDFSSYLESLPAERRKKIEARAAEIRLEERGAK